MHKTKTTENKKKKNLYFKLKENETRNFTLRVRNFVDNQNNYL